MRPLKESAITQVRTQETISKLRITHIEMNMLKKLSKDYDIKITPTDNGTYIEVNPSSPS